MVAELEQTIPAGAAMAIKFADKGPEDEPKPERAPRPAAPLEKPAEAVQADPPGGMPDGQLPFAKSKPKPRGRKKPLK